jgi:serine/threonine protein kinase
MGEVWHARDEILQRDVAIKEIDLVVGSGEDTLHRRTLREARAAARLSHPNVVQVFDILEEAGRARIVMEYVPSRSLQEVLRDDGPLEPRTAAMIGLEVLAALRAAHRAGVDHRDVKPGNVLLADDGRVLLTDFGIATIEGDSQASSGDMVIGSPEYMSPERARHGTAGLPSDLWSLGATLFAAVEGHSPFHRASAVGTLTALATEEPKPPRQAGVLGPVLEGLLRRDPAARIDADETERRLRAAIEGDLTAPDETPTQAAPAPAAPSPATPAPAASSSAAPSPAAPAPAASPPAVPAPAASSSVAPETAAPGSGASSPAAPERTEPEPSRGRATVGPPPAVADDVVPAPARRPGKRLLGAAAAVLVAVLGVTTWLVTRPDSGDAGQQAAPPAATTTPSAESTSDSSAPANPPVESASTAPAQPPPSSAATGGDDGGLPALPAGWTNYRDRTGFSVYVPADWKRSREGTMVYFRGDGRVLGIDQTKTPARNPVADWKGKAEYRQGRGDFPSYREVHIKSVDYWRKAADWEFSFARGGTRQHVNNRGFIVADDQAYGIWWQTSDSSWSAARGDLDLIFDSFRPAS